MITSEVTSSWMQWKSRSRVGQHFSCNYEICVSICSVLPYYSLTGKKVQAGQETPAFEGCPTVLFCCCLDFSPLTRHCRRTLITYCLEEVKRVFTLVFRDVRTNWLPLYRDERMDLGKVQVPKVLRTLSHTTEPRKWDWASESSSKCPSVVCMDGFL